MMNHTLKNRCSFKPGEVIEGKWHKNKYTIIKELGNGANGIVYLAWHQNRHVALKISENSMSITSEVNVLKSFAKVQGSTLGPSLMDVDDWKSRQGMVSFYAMEYITGSDLLSFIERNGKSWVAVLIIQLLNDLEQLHRNGWIFGDLKPENLIVTGPPTRIRCIDVGGTTIRGRAIKEFTEFYDRGYWGLGSRKAEPSYDLFAVGMVIINTAYPKRFHKQTGGMHQLTEAIRQKPELQRLEPVIFKSLRGQYSNAKQMRQELLSLATASSRTMKKQDGEMMHQLKPTPAPLKQNKLRLQRYSPKKKKKGGVVETLFILAVVAAFYFLYISGKLF
ncbi:serine/threonine protein kinase [Bacillota bacterium Lsc_1132]